MSSQPSTPTPTETLQCLVDAKKDYNEAANCFLSADNQDVFRDFKCYDSSQSQTKCGVKAIELLTCFSNAMKNTDQDNAFLNCLIEGKTDKDLNKKMICYSNEIENCGDECNLSSCKINPEQLACMNEKYTNGAKTEDGSSPTPETINNIANCLMTDDRNKDLVKNIMKTGIF